MLKHYLTIALRTLRRHKVYSVLNIVGLTVGMACCLLIFVLVQHELSFDRFHAKRDRIYRLTMHVENSPTPKWASVLLPLGEALKAEYPEVEEVVRIQTMGNPLVQHGEVRAREERAFYVDPSFFKVFDFAVLKGDVLAGLRRPLSGPMWRRRSAASHEKISRPR